MLDHLIGIAEDKKLESIHGVVLVRNTRMLELCRRMGFRLEKKSPEEVQVTLDLAARDLTGKELQAVRRGDR